MSAGPGTTEAIGPMQVLAFWRAAGPDKWFEKDAAFDAEIAARFSCLWQTGRDGRAGMAAIVAKDNLNLTALRDHLAQQLPEYARPVFLRIRKNNDVTTTFKQKKINLLKEGFDPTLTTDPIYFNDPQRKAFVRVDPELYDRIKNAEVRL